MLDRSIIHRPHITEKAALLSTQGTYVFVVAPGATKNEIRKAVKAIYNVDATAVTIVNSPSKQKGFGRTRAYTGAFKKAMVTIKKGQTLALA